MTIKFTKKQLQNFLNEVNALENFVLREKVSVPELKNIEKMIINLRAMGDGSSAISQAAENFKEKVLNDLATLNKLPETTPEESKEFEKLVTNFITGVALIFHQDIFNKIKGKKGIPVAQALGTDNPEEFVKTIASKLGSFALAINSGASKGASKIRSSQIDHSTYQLSPTTINSFLRDMLKMSVEQFRENYSEATSLLQNVGLKSPTVPPKAPVDPTGKTLEPFVYQRPQFNDNEFKNDIVNFWGTLSSQEKHNLMGLQQIMAKHNLLGGGTSSPQQQQRQQAATAAVSKGKGQRLDPQGPEAAAILNSPDGRGELQRWANSQKPTRG